MNEITKDKIFDDFSLLSGESMNTLTKTCSSIFTRHIFLNTRWPDYTIYQPIFKSLLGTKAFNPT